MFKIKTLKAYVLELEERLAITESKLLEIEAYIISNKILKANEKSKDKSVKMANQDGEPIKKRSSNVTSAS